MKRDLLKFVIINIIVVVALITIAYQYRVYKQKQKNKKEETFLDWFNQGEVSTKDIFVGFVFGFVFGFIDNFFLWIGTTHIQKYVKGGPLMKAGWGNTYSDFIGATVGTALASMIKNYLGYDDEKAISTPIWVDAISIPAGCIVGMYMGKHLLK